MRICINRKVYKFQKLTLEGYGLILIAILWVLRWKPYLREPKRRY